MSISYDEMYQEEEEKLNKLGYEIVNVSKVFPWVREMDNIRNVRPEYELKSLKTGEVILTYMDCSYSCALSFFKKKAQELIKEANAAQ